MTLLICSMSGCGCGKNKMYDSGENGYTKTNAVEGLSFEIVSNISRNATAVTNISDTMDFDVSNTYVYKDGKENYILFNIQSLVFACKKDTSFGMRNAEDKVAALENDNIVGVWPESPKKKLNYDTTEKDGVWKMIATVNAGVVITTDIYNDYTGKLIVMDDGTTEWTCFIGTVGTDYSDLDKDMKKTLEYMAKTVTLDYTVEEITTENPEVVLGGTEEEPTEEQTEEQTKESVSDNTVSDNTVSENVVENVSDNSIEPQTETVDINIEETVEDITVEEITVEIEEETETTEETTEETIEETIEEDTASEEITETEEPSTEEITENATEKPVSVEPTEKPEKKPSTTKKEPLTLNNQSSIKRDDKTVYESDIYNMLSIGNKAYVSTITRKGYEKAVIQVTDLYKGKDAENIIKDSCKNKLVSYNYFPADEGCTWHVIKFNIDYGTCSEKGYIDVRLKGLDGEKLKYRGVPYSKRTYLIKLNEKEFYCYYSVPNGCKEYALECGEGTVNNKDKGIVAAYYYIKE